MAAVKACYVDDARPCDWLVKVGRDEDGQEVIRDCGANTIVTDRGWGCEAGHGHTFAEVRHAEGWTYAECEDEVKALAKAGVRGVPVAFGG